MDAQTLTALGALLIGWLLAELSGLFKLRRDDRRSLGRALAHLLENHRRLTMAVAMFHPKYCELDPAVRAAAEAGALTALEQMESLRSGMSEIVESVSGVDPLLGADLRIALAVNLRGLLQPIVESRRSLSELPTVEADLRQVLKEMDSMLLRVAWRHGIVTWLRVSRFVGASANIDLLFGNLPRPKGPTGGPAA